MLWTDFNPKPPFSLGVQIVFQATIFILQLSPYSPKKKLRTNLSGIKIQAFGSKKTGWLVDKESEEHGTD